MRSGVLAMLAVWCAACEASGGLELEIDASADPGATEVRIYVGRGDGEHASIAGEGQNVAPIHDGKFWPLTAPDVVEKLGLTNHRQTLSFRPTEGITRLTVVAVGLTNNVPTSVATVTRAALRSDVIEVWQLVLEPASSTLENPSGRAVVWWGIDPEQSTCVQAVDRSKDPENVFIGLEGDRDCDGWPHGKRSECSDLEHDAVQVPAHDKLSCMEPTQLVDALNNLPFDACMLGSRDCVDGMPAERVDCSKLISYCAPQGLCDECTETDTDARFRCALDLDPEDHSDTIPRAVCVIQIDKSVDPPRLCDQELKTTPPVDWVSTTTTCQNPPLFHPKEASKPWASTVEIGGVALDFGTVTAPGLCNVLVSPRAVAGRSISRSAFPTHGLVSIQLGQSTGAIAPVVFELQEVDVCGPRERMCHLDPIGTNARETVQRCIRAKREAI